MADDELVALDIGTRVAGIKTNWTIDRKLGAGAFGAVFLCRNDKGVLGALKTESVTARHKLLVMEVHVMLALHTLKDGRHFCQCLDQGRDTQTGHPAPTDNGIQPPPRACTFNFIVMTLVGRGLDSLVRDAGGRFSIGTAIGISIQLLNALRAMHSIGYLHRDIKPANAAMGRVEDREQRLLYLLDFGMARRYMHDDGTLRRPRADTNFRGSPRYASITAHIGREYSRKDDIESWFYLMVELVSGTLPFGNLNNMEAIGEMKMRRMPNQPSNVRRDAIAALLKGCPSEFGEILRHIDGLKYYARPDYRMMMQTLRNYLENNNIAEHPYDWEAGRRNDGPGRAGGAGKAVDSYFN